MKAFKTLAKPKRLASLFGKDQRGITGLETAIILIAFVVVASVFSFTVLSTGLFSSERGKETIIAGLREARETLEPRGSVIANGAPRLMIDDAETNWTAAANVTSALDTSDFKEGSASVELTVDALFTTGLVASDDITAIDLTNYTYARLWIKSTLAIGTAGDLELVLDDSAGCGTPLANIDLPALTAATWTNVAVALPSAAQVSGIACVGLNATVNPGVTVINVDYIRAPGIVTSLVFNVVTAVGGTAIDLTTPTDSDSDGVADSDSEHVTVIGYIDENQNVKDIYWTKSLLGNGDTDDLLERREMFQITVPLTALGATTPLEADETFTLEVKPTVGALLVIRRTVPAEIDTITNLQ